MLNLPVVGLVRAPSSLLASVLVAAVLSGSFGAIASAQASGGRTIDSAPTLNFGELQTGGGVQSEFWRLPVFGGDRVTFRIDFPAANYSTLDLRPIAPSWDDFTISQYTEDGLGAILEGKSQRIWRSPFTGLATLWVTPWRNGPELMPSYSFTATAEHASSLSISGVPRRIRRGRSFKITARVQSPAGAPAGNCLFQPVGGRGLRPRGPVALVGGVCSATVKAGTGRSARYRVTFEGADGWLDTSQTTRTVIVQKRSFR